MRTRNNGEQCEREKEMIQRAKSEAVREEEATRHKKTWGEMRERLESFERIIREDKGDAAGGPPSTPVAFTPRRLSTEVKGSPDKIAKEPDTDVKMLVKKLQKSIETPQEVYVTALDEYEEEDKETWAAHFPPGYRERIAPQFLGEIYSTGKAKTWAKEWVKERQLGDCSEAREIIAVAASIDSIFLQDQVQGAINQLNTEKMARKMMGIKMAFQDVRKESDWRKPAGSKSGWKERIDREMWKRIDPNVEEVDHIFINRKAENELRSEMDRDAAMLKAKAKLSDRTKDTPEAPPALHHCLDRPVVLLRLLLGRVQ
jgi:hypothetical protein